MTRLLIVDDHALVREGLKHALALEGFNSIDEADCVATARSQLAAMSPDVVVVDINLPDASGFELITWIRSKSQNIGIIVLTLHQEDSYILAAMRAGATAFISKTQPIPQLVAAIHHSVIAPLSFSAQGLDQILHRSENNLTAREFDLLTALEKGLTTLEISELLFISQATVKTHLASIYRKLEVSNRTGAVHEMHKRGLTGK